MLGWKAFQISLGTSLVVQWLRIHLPMQETMDSVSGRGGFHMLRGSYTCVPQLPRLHAATVEADVPRVHAPKQGKPPQREALCCLVAQSCPTLCDPMDCSTQGLPVPLHLPDFTQVHSYPLNWWCHPTISFSVSLFSCLQSFLASGSFPMNVHGWFPLGSTGLIFLLFKGLCRDFSWEACTPQRISVLKNTPYPSPPQVILGNLKSENH